MAGWHLWLAALIFSISAIHLALAAEQWPARHTGFDRPLNRVIIRMFAYATFIMGLIYAATLDGLVWPGLAAALIWGAWSLARRFASFERVYRLALPLAMIAFICDFALFSTIFEGGFFGLFGGPRGF